MRLHPTSRTLRRITLLATGLMASALIQMPAVAAGSNLGQFTKGALAPADITGAVIFGKNGEVIPLDAKGKPAKACVMSKTAADAAKAKKSALPECEIGNAKGGADAPKAEGPKAKDGGTPCQGYYIVWIGGVAMQIWYPAGCTPPY
ncbi:MAG: hypothetical protein JSR69_15705 [Proteobacteria bacterium]|nr:hypothetical protein [Pseudomonadota bacterium]